MVNQSAAVAVTPPAPQEGATTPVTYMVAGRKFIVEPVFKEKEQSQKTIGDILLKLMLNEE